MFFLRVENLLRLFAFLVIFNSSSALLAEGFIAPEVVVQGEGISDSVEGAKKAMILDAVSRVTSTFTMSKETVINDDIQSKIATFSDGVVKQMTITSGPTKGADGLYRIAGNVVVIRRNLVDSLRKENLAISATVRSDDLFARAVTMEALRKNSGELLQMLFEEDPRRYSARLVGEINTVPVTQLTEQEVKSGGISWITATVGVSANIEAYRTDYAARLEKILVSISESNARYSGDFEKFEEAKGYVYPIFSKSSDVTKAVSTGFSNLSFGAVTDSWSPPRGTEHIYQNLFIKGQTAYSKKVASAPVFTSRAKWMLASKKRPFVGYNVIMVGLDHNGFPTLNGYGIAPAFFTPFENLLDQYEKSENKGSCLVVSLSLMRKDGSLLRKLEHPLPRGQWLTPAFYAGRAKEEDQNKRLVLMPIGMSPAFCDALQIKQARTRLGVIISEQNIISAFSTITNASASFRFPMSSEDLAKISNVRVSTHVTDENK